MGVGQRTPTQKEILADYQRFDQGCNVDTAACVAMYVPGLLDRITALERELAEAKTRLDKQDSEGMKDYALIEDQALKITAVTTQRDAALGRLREVSRKLDTWERYSLAVVTMREEFGPDLTRDLDQPGESELARLRAENDRLQLQRIELRERLGVLRAVMDEPLESDKDIDLAREGEKLTDGLNAQGDANE